MPSGLLFDTIPYQKTLQTAGVQRLFVGCLLSSSEFLPLYPTAKPKAVKTKSQTPRRKAPHKVSVLLVRPSPLSFQRRQSLCQRAARIPGHRVSKEIQRLCVRAKGFGFSAKGWRSQHVETICGRVNFTGIGCKSGAVGCRRRASRRSWGCSDTCGSANHAAVNAVKVPGTFNPDIPETHQAQEIYDFNAGILNPLQRNGSSILSI